MEADREFHELTNAEIDDLAKRCGPVVRAWLDDIGSTIDPGALANKLALGFAGRKDDRELRQCEAAVYGHMWPDSWVAGLGVGCSLFDAICAFVKTEEVVAGGSEHKERIWRYLLRFRTALSGADPRLAAVTADVISAYFAGPRTPIAKAQEHFAIIRAFLEWCVGWELLTGAVLADFREWHPVFGKYSRYRRGKSAGEATP